jgi:hypothetical protein
MKKDLLKLIVAMLIVSPTILALNDSENIFINLIGFCYATILFLFTKYHEIGKRCLRDVYRSSIRIGEWLKRNLLF